MVLLKCSIAAFLEQSSRAVSILAEIRLLHMHHLHNRFTFIPSCVQAAKVKGHSLMQPLRDESSKPSSAAAIGSAAFAAMAERDVPADALIFHK